MCIICSSKHDLNFLKNIEELNCSGCPLLTTLPKNMPKLKILNCFECISLTMLPKNTPKLKLIDCSGCPLLTELPEKLPLLRELYCIQCPLLTRLPENLPLLRELNCSGCPLLTHLPKNTPNLLLYCIDDCYWLEPENVKLGIQIQNWYIRRQFLFKHKKLFFQILYTPPNYPGTIENLFPDGGYNFRKEMMENYE